jgi:hypothetical protein
MRYPTGKERTAMTEAIADRANLEKQLAEQMQQKSDCRNAQSDGDLY